ncbi:YIP1 family protein [Pseudoruegeria sp. HB172150]|uniref:YIP1 family protein n=1 Tax=Pseudoruegeria sp. HB172150 TaxID=2721164 RepID=UPI001556DE8F|nr:YIP1 family protein [Pseudoruegeria sp. HB172150]
MAVTTDMAAMYRRPRAVVRRLQAAGPREDRALIFLMVACLLIFVAQWPRLSREAYLNPEISLQARLGGALFAWLFIVPLFAYLLAGASRLIARLFGGQGTGYSARLALFWSLLAAAPLWLLNGLVAGFVGPGLALNITGGLALAIFLLFWGVSLRETEKADAVA